MNTTPDYVVIEERGPDHAREFLVMARVGEQSFDAAWGRSKKEAEQQAARFAMNGLVQTSTEQKESADDESRAEQDRAEAAE
ncbi:MAG: hypothetical protein KDA96_25970 [Planctomycetaceae bacterium]|nr:hypothetical protein [Planctomycetaceae bacterium]